MPETRFAIPLALICTPKSREVESSVMTRILLIKTGYSETLDADPCPPGGPWTPSLGDVLRTTVVLDVLADHSLAWLVDERAAPLLRGIPEIDSLVTCTDPRELGELDVAAFDRVINMEKVPELCALEEKRGKAEWHGFGLDRGAGRFIATPEWAWALELCRDRERKRRHRDPWGKVLVEALGHEWTGQRTRIGSRPSDRPTAAVGLNHKVGAKWPTKEWPATAWQELASQLSASGASVSWQRGFDDLEEYIAWIDSCATLITTDSLGLHIALALEKPVVVIYGPTHAHEAYLYDRGVRVAAEDFSCHPCLSATCDAPVHCLSALETQCVFEAWRALETPST